jgi:hypothetical protein
MKNRVKYLILSLLLPLSAVNADYKTDLDNIDPVLKKEIIAQVEQLYKELIIDDRDITFLEKKGMLKYFGTEEREKTRKIAEKHNLDVEDLYKVIYKESRGNPQAQNSITNATGLIQFMPKTAERFNTSVEALLSMSVLEQLDYVDNYIGYWSKIKPIDSYLDLYLCIFYPAAIGKDLSYVISNGGHVYKANKGIDRSGNNDGVLTLCDINTWLS